jgi:guanylate kinase
MSVDCVLQLNNFCAVQGIQHIAIHLLSPTAEVLSERMRLRGDSQKDISRRLTECGAWDDLAQTIDFIRLVPPMSQLETFNHVVDVIG